jgi:hypothetical protein
MPETATDYLMAALAGFVAGLPYTFPGWIALIVGMIVWLRDPD